MIMAANIIIYSLIYYLFAGFFHPFASLSIVPFILSFLVSSLLAVTIHSRYSFLLVKESESNAVDSFLFFFNDDVTSSGKRTSFVSDLIHLNISLSSLGFASLFRWAYVLVMTPFSVQL